MYTRRDVTDGVTVMNKDLYDNLQDGIDGLNDRLRDVELFKFPNAIIIGNPNINNGQVSGFDTDNYLQFPYLVNFDGRAFEIDTEVTTSGNVSTAQKIFDCNFGFSFGIDGGKFLLAISSNGTSWDIINQKGTFDVDANTTYRLKLTWDKSLYKLSVSIDGGESYTEDITVESELSPYPRQVFIGIRHNLTSPFLGIINLNRSILLIDSVLEWQGMDDVGIASRMDRDLSNITTSGKEVVKEFAKENQMIFENIGVSVASFSSDSTYSDYPYKAVVPLNGVDSESIVTVNFDMKEATDFNYAPICKSGEGNIEIYANRKPLENIIIPTIIATKGVSI